MYFIRDQINAFFPLIDEWEVLANAVAPAFKATILTHLLVSLLVIYIDLIIGLSASMRIQENLPGKRIEEKLVSLAEVAPSEQAIHLRLVVG